MPPPMYQGYNESSFSTNPAYPGPPPAYSGTAPGKLANVEFGQTSTRAVCGNCQSEVLTNVNSSISSQGWAWAVVCCLCGIIWVSLLALCFPGFRKFTHTCPNCKALMAEVVPKHETKHKIILVLSVLLVIAFITFLVIYQAWLWSDF